MLVPCTRHSMEGHSHRSTIIAVFSSCVTVMLHCSLLLWHTAPKSPSSLQTTMIHHDVFCRINRGGFATFECPDHQSARNGMGWRERERESVCVRVCVCVRLVSTDIIVNHVKGTNAGSHNVLISKTWMGLLLSCVDNNRSHYYALISLC